MALLTLTLLAAATAVRVVSQTVGTDEALLAVAQPEQIAALSPLARDPQFCAVPGEAAKYPILSVGGDAESVLKFHPTVVFCADYSRIELISQLRTAGVRVVVFNRYATLDDAYDMLRRVAAEVGAGDRAEQIIASCQERTNTLARKLAGVRPVNVLAPSSYGVIAGRDTTFDDLCQHAGAVNLAATLGRWKGYQAPPAEALLAWPIDRLVLGGADANRALAPFRALPPYAYMAAVKEGRAVVLPPWVLGCVSHLRIDGYYALARALHPGLVLP